MLLVQKEASDQISNSRSSEYVPGVRSALSWVFVEVMAQHLDNSAIGPSMPIHVHEMTSENLKR